MKADLLALAAIALWGTLAPLGVKLSHIPPFLLTGLGLLVGSLIALPLARFRLTQWRVPIPTLLVGVYGLFGFHFLLFMALRNAPAVEANLINYLWPLGMVVLAPLFLKGSLLKCLMQTSRSYMTWKVGNAATVSMIAIPADHNRKCGGGLRESLQSEP